MRRNRGTRRVSASNAPSAATVARERRATCGSIRRKSSRWRHRSASPTSRNLNANTSARLVSAVACVNSPTATACSSIPSPVAARFTRHDRGNAGPGLFGTRTSAPQKPGGRRVPFVQVVAMGNSTRWIRSRCGGQQCASDATRASVGAPLDSLITMGSKLLLGERTIDGRRVRKSTSGGTSSWWKITHPGNL